MHKPINPITKAGWLIPLLALLALACRFSIPQTTPAAEPTQTPYVIVATSASPSSSIQVVSEDQLLVELYARVNPAVVNITVYASQNGEILALGAGSGFIYDTQGNIVTNAHVVHGAEQIEVTLSNGLIVSTVLIGEDLHSDLAVVRAAELPAGIVPLPLGDMSTLAVGQTVIAIGNPWGLSGTLTRGVISALGRTIPALTVFSIPQAIQTDAAINPGNSGGPLLNLDGEVIGVNAQIETGGTGRANTGVGFAIPVSIVQRVVPVLINDGHYNWPWLGVSGYDVNPTLVEAMNLPVERGAYIAEVVAGGPALQAGLRGANNVSEVNGRTVEVGGDVVTAVDGQIVNTFDDLLVYLALHTSPGQEITLTIVRDGEFQEVVVLLAERPNQ